MEAQICDNAVPTQQVLDALRQHLPYSLPTLRRLQFMKTSVVQTLSSHVLSSFDAEAPGKDFLVASLDLSKCPETEMWLYSSIENPDRPGDEIACETQILQLFERVRELERSYQGRRATPGIVMVATLHKTILEILEKHSMVKAKTEEHFKFIFKMGELPPGKPLPENLSWSTINPSDISLVLSRTEIPYQAATMKLLPSAAIISQTRTPIAWVFLGLDGSIKTLHCEEEYRGRGLAKAVTLRLLRERTADFGEDQFSHADVAVKNIQSQGVCKSLKGTIRWRNYFAWIDISSAAEGIEQIAEPPSI